MVLPICIYQHPTLEVSSQVSLRVAFGDFKVAGAVDLLEGAGIDELNE